MDFQRLFLFLIFSVSLFLLWDGWQRTQQPAPIAPTTAPQNQGVPSPTINAVAPEATVVAVQQKNLSGQKITVKTDYLIAEIDTAGGNLGHLQFLQQRDGKDSSKPFVLFQAEGEHIYAAQTGLLGAGLPNHNAMFSTEATEYLLKEGAQTLEVRLQAVETEGTKVTKIYRFHRASYLIDVGYEIENLGSATLAPSAYYQLVRDKTPPEGDSMLVPTYTGPAVYTEQEKFQKVDFADIEKGKAKFTQRADNGWVGMLQHYFVSA